MTTPPHPRRPKSGAALLTLLLLPTLLLAGLVAGCGQETPPGQAVPVLADRLDRVDAAVEARNYRQATDAVEALVAETAQAEAAGEISNEQADRILTAAQNLLALLPADAPVKDPSHETDPPEEGGEAGEGDHNDKEDKDKDDKDKEKDESEGEGSENGPDDGNGD